jgi:hypothetical protein
LHYHAAHDEMGSRLAAFEKMPRHFGHGLLAYKEGRLERGNGRVRSSLRTGHLYGRKLSGLAGNASDNRNGSADGKHEYTPKAGGCSPTLNARPSGSSRCLKATVHRY